MSGCVCACVCVFVLGGGGGVAYLEKQLACIGQEDLRSGPDTTLSAHRPFLRWCGKQSNSRMYNTSAFQPIVAGCKEDRQGGGGRDSGGACLHDAGGALAGGAVELILFKVGDGDEAALLAHVHPVRVALVEQPLLPAAKSPLEVLLQRVLISADIHTANMKVRRVVV